VNEALTADLGAAPRTALARVSAPPAIALGALACSIVAFAPRLWLYARHPPSPTQWTRAYTFIQQASNPFRPDVEIVMRWRLLPALIAHYAGLRGEAALIVPWLGVVFFLTYVAATLLRRSGDGRFAFGGTLLIATTFAVIWPVDVPGSNDAWVWLGLTALAVEESLAPALIACLLCPWVDERFIIGAPLAWIAGRLGRDQRLLSRDLTPLVCALAVYGSIRFVLGEWLGVHTVAAHLRKMAAESARALRYGPMGWWMGLRAAWIPIGLCFDRTPHRWAMGLALAATALTTIALTEDHSRSAAIAVPLAILGLLDLRRRQPERAATIALILGGLGLLLPVAAVQDTGLSLTDNLFTELFRFWRLHR
jgi:hypothetical protein